MNFRNFRIFSVEDESDAVFPTQINTLLKTHIAPRIIIKVCLLKNLII